MLLLILPQKISPAELFGQFSSLATHSQLDFVNQCFSIMVPRIHCPPFFCFYGSDLKELVIEKSFSRT